MNDVRIKQQCLPESLSREVVTLDGHRLTLHAGKDAEIPAGAAGILTLPLAWLDDVHFEVRLAAFAVVADLVGTHSAIYAQKSSTYLRAATEAGLFEDTPVTPTGMIAVDRIAAGYAQFIRPTLRRMAEADPAIFDDDARELLFKDGLWEEKQNGSYFALVTNCAERGALTEQELTNLHSELNRAHAEKRLSLEQFALAWMFLGTGLRPIQIARMQRRDVQVLDGPQGKEVNLRVPLAKGERTNRTEYWLRRAPSVLADVLLAYLDGTKVDTGSALFFPTSKQIQSALKDACAKLRTYSQRLGGAIPISPYRFRYTLATRALAHGASDWEVARLLTHRSTQCVQRYRSSMPELQQPIHSAIGIEMAYFARAFQGRLIGSLAEATRKDEGEAEILDFMHLTQPASLGACGTRAACNQHAPIACLTCPLFEPFRDAPWAELAESLAADSARESDPKIRSIHDHALSAVHQIQSLSQQELR